MSLLFDYYEERNLYLLRQSQVKTTAEIARSKVAFHGET